MDRLNLVVYSAIVRNYNAVLCPSRVDDSLDYICFSDQPFWNGLINNTVWDIRPFPKETRELEATRKCRMVKILPHLFFPEYDYSVWVDGSIDIIGDIRALIATHDYPDLLCFKHPKRDCVYEEGKACIDLGKDDPQVINNQLDAYHRQGFPEHAGLIESGVMIRKHNDPEIIKVMESWWQELSTHSRRDQLSFPYAAWRHGRWPPPLMGEDNVWGSSAVFRLRRESYHGGKPLTMLDRARILADKYLLWRLKR